MWTKIISEDIVSIRRPADHCSFPNKNSILTNADHECLRHEWARCQELKQAARRSKQAAVDRRRGGSVVAETETSTLSPAPARNVNIYTFTLFRCQEICWWNAVMNNVDALGRTAALRSSPIVVLRLLVFAFHLRALFLFLWVLNRYRTVLS